MLRPQVPDANSAVIADCRKLVVVWSGEHAAVEAALQTIWQPAYVVNGMAVRHLNSRQLNWLQARDGGVAVLFYRVALDGLRHRRNLLDVAFLVRRGEPAAAGRLHGLAHAGAGDVPHGDLPVDEPADDDIWP